MVLNVDEMLDIIGSMRLFQWRTVILIGLLLLPTTFQTLIMTFLASEPAWKCRNDSLVCNVTGTFEPDAAGELKNLRCEMDTSEWEFVPHYNSIITEWNLVCDDSLLGILATSCTFAGWFFGNIIMGMLSDRYGRRKVLFSSVFGVSFFGLISSFVHQFALYVVLRFCIGFCLGGAIVSLFIMATEFVGPHHRAMAGTFTWYFWTASLMLTAVLAYFIRDWRTLSIVSSVPGLFGVLFWWFIPESARWLMTHGRIEEAAEILIGVAKVNRRQMPEDDHLGMEQDESVAQAVEAGFGDLFRNRSMTKKTLISWFSWFVNAQVYFGVSLGSVMLGGNRYLNFFLTSLIEIPGNAFAIWSMDRFGRKMVVVVGLVLASIANLIVIVIPKEEGNDGYIAGRLIMAMFGKFSIMCSFDAIFVFSAELFPTVVRNMGLGTSSAAGRIGAISSPFIIWLNRITPTLPYIVMAVDAFIAGLLCMLLPETNKEPTPEFLQDDSSPSSKTARFDDNELQEKTKMI